VDGALVVDKVTGHMVPASKLVGMTFCGVNAKKDPMDGVAEEATQMMRRAMQELEKVASSSPPPSRAAYEPPVIHTHTGTISELIASVCHEVNAAYCRATGDDSQPAWDDAEAWQRGSAVKGVKMALENRHATPQTMHQAWTEEKVRTGWVHGEVKDPVKKTHPCLVPYSDLPAQQRVKDHLFLAVVRSAAKALALDEPDPRSQEH
jgi:hypothetical protein